MVGSNSITRQTPVLSSPTPIPVPAGLGIKLHYSCRFVNNVEYRSFNVVMLLATLAVRSGATITFTDKLSKAP